MSIKRRICLQGATIALLATLTSAELFAASNNLVSGTAFGDVYEIVVTFARPVTNNQLLERESYQVFEEPDPDIRLEIESITLSDDGSRATLRFSETLNQSSAYVINIKGLADEGGALSFTVKQSYLGHLFTILITAMLIKNFVFTKYLGLCVFMGTSKKKKTAKGMGLTFALVMAISASMSWVIYNFLMIPFKLTFLQIVVFIGLVALSVQAVDTILRKLNPALFASFGIYLVLITTNCVIIAVPLMLANEGFGFWESLMLAIGAGSGFMLALYLMASVRERLDVALVPESFKGLPVAFLVAGQFALAFLGFSGMSI